MISSFETSVASAYDADTTIHEIDFTPHYHAITNAGKSQFARISDATAELIDNSIQACSHNTSEEKRIINVSLFVGKTVRGTSLKSQSSSVTEGFLCVTDNGCGMDEHGLNEFAIYSLDQVTRGKAPSQQDNHSFISKFGVGAKQAGFFLGKSIRVLTKMTGNDKVCELLLDQNKFRERYESDQSVYKGEILVRSKADTIRHINDKTLFGSDVPSSLMDLMKEHLTSNDHFSAVIIHLHSETLSRLLDMDRYLSLPFDIAEIYHFHLHPEHKFHSLPVTERDKFCKQASDTTFKYDRMSRVSSPLDITIQMELHGNIAIEFISLRDLHDTVSRCVASSASDGLFRFIMNIPDPFPEVNGNVALQSQLAGELTSAAIKTFRVEGMLFYFPYVDGKETRPISLNTNSSSSTTSIPSIGDADEDVRTPPSVGGDTAYDHDPTFSVYWQDRLVPETVVSRLPFFPQCTSRYECSKEDIPKKWKWRVKGCLFLDWNFQYISNNKLKLQIPNFDDWLNSQDTIRNTIWLPTNSKPPFKRFLQDCHKRCDREFYFENPSTELETLLRGKGSSSSLELGCFTCMHVGSEIIIKEGDKIKIKTKKGTIFVNVRGFRSCESISPQETKYYGKAELIYNRIPEELFGGDIVDTSTKKHTILVTNIDFSSHDKYEVTKDDLNELLRLKPIDVEVAIFEAENGEPHIISDGYELTSGVDYYKFGVQIMSKATKKSSDRITNIPKSTQKYTVRMTLGDKNANPVTDYGKSNDLWVYEPADSCDVKVNAKTGLTPGHIASSWYSFGNYGEHEGKYPLRFKSTGTHPLLIQVIDTHSSGYDYVVFSKTIHVRIKACIVSDFSLTFDSEVPEGPLQLGSYLPSFTIKFLDNNLNQVKYAEPAMFYITSNDMVVTTSNIEHAIFEMEDDGSIAFDQSCLGWLPTPKPKFFPANNHVAITREVEFTLRVYLPKNSDGAMMPNNFTIELNAPKKFKFTFIPGKPYNFHLIEPSEEVIHVTNQSVFPTCIFAFIDTWGFNTAPITGQPWLVEADFKGPLEFLVNPVEASSTGRANFHEPSIHVSDAIPISGLLLEQLFTLRDGSGNDFLSNTSSTPSNMINDHIPTFSLSIVVIPSNVPDKVELLYNNVPIPRPWQVPVNTTLSNLTYRIIDESGDVLDFQADWFRMKNTGATVSWSEKEKKSKNVPKLKTMTLPNLHIPKTISSSNNSNDHEIDIELCVILSDDKKLYDTISIIPMPLMPASIDIITSKNLIEGISNGDSDDLLRKIERIIFFDEHDNITKPRDDSIDPHILISWTEEEISLFMASLASSIEATAVANDHHHMMDEDIVSKRRGRKRGSSTNNRDDSIISSSSSSSKKTRSNDDHDDIRTNKQTSLSLILSSSGDHYIIKPGSYIISPAGLSHVPVWITAYDASCKMKPCTKQCTIIAGLSYQLALSSHTLDIMTPSSSYDIIINRFVDVNDMKLYVHDRSHTKAHMKRVKNITYDIQCIIPHHQHHTDDHHMDDDVMIHYQRSKRIPSSEFTMPPLSMHKIMSEFAKNPAIRDDISSFNIIISASYKLDSSSSSDDHIMMKPVILRCSMMKMNAVLNLDIDITSLSSSISSDNIMTCPCDDVFPNIIIHAITDDHQPLILSSDDVSYEVNVNSDVTPWGVSSSHSIKPSSKNHQHHIHDVTKYFTIISSGNDVKPTLTLSVDPSSSSSSMISLLPLGLYTIKIQYHERRMIMSSLPDPLKKIDAFKRFHLINGQPQMIMPSIISKPLLENLTKSNTSSSSSSSSSRHERIIGENLIFHICDRCHHPCKLSHHDKDHDIIIRCFINSSPSLSSSFVPPLLEGADDGYLYSKHHHDGIGYVFPHIAIAPDTGVGEGIIEIIFEACHIPSSSSMIPSPPSSSSVTDKNIIIYILPVNFITNEGRLRIINALRIECNQHKDIISRYDLERASIRDDITIYHDKIFRYMKKASDKNLHQYIILFHDDFHDVDDIIVDDFCHHYRILEQQYNDMTSYQTQIRSSISSSLSHQASLLRHHINAGVYGRVVDIAYVDDPHLAKILSWGAIQYMDAMIVESSEIGRQFYDIKQKAWALDQMISFMIHDRGDDGKFNPRGRNHYEISSQSLPLPSLSSIPGNPRYLVNLIQLSHDHERLRDTIYWNIYKKGLLFDDMSSALNYRRELTRLRQPAPLILTLDGNRIGSDGMMNPVNNTLPVETLRYMYGQMPTQSERDLAVISSDIKIVEEVMPLLRQCQQRKQELGRLLSGADAMAAEQSRTRLQELEAELVAHSAGILPTQPDSS